jgi:hypothetical protein
MFFQEKWTERKSLQSGFGTFPLIMRYFTNNDSRKRYSLTKLLMKDKLANLIAWLLRIRGELPRRKSNYLAQK